MFYNQFVCEYVTFTFQQCIFYYYFHIMDEKWGIENLLRIQVTTKKMKKIKESFSLNEIGSTLLYDWDNVGIIIMMHLLF